MKARKFGISLVILVNLNTLQIVYGAQQGLLEEVRTAHQSSIAYIRSCSCDVSITYEPVPAGGNESGKYWRSGETARCQCESKIGKDDVLIQGDRLLCLNTYPLGGRGYETSGTIIENKIPIKCDVWTYGLLTFFGREKFRVSFDELLTQPHEIHSVKRVQEDGRELVYVDLSHGRARLGIWFDQQVNHLVRKMQIETIGAKDEKLRSVQNVVSFKEAAPGIYFPERVETRDKTGNRAAASMSVTFSNIHINEPLPPDIFKLKFPSGVFVSDLIQGKILKTNSKGEPKLQATDGQGNPLSLSGAAPIPLAAKQGERHRVTQEETQSFTRWLLPISLGILASAALLWVLGKWRRRVRSV